MNNSKSVFIGLFFVLISTTIYVAGKISGGALFPTPDSKKEYLVVLGIDGFEPKEIRIEKGGTVTWKTTRNSYFWPASNLHPTHDIYPEFDPKEPLAPEESWSFQFDKTGEWKYHDHLAPYFTGVVTVLSSNKSQAETKPIDCDKIDDDSLSKTRKNICWEEEIVKILDKKDVTAAFAFLKIGHDKYPDFDIECHSAAHRIGQKLFKEFLQNPSIQTPQEAEKCAFGVYHGFMEELITSNADILIAHKFCQSIKRDLVHPVDQINECYHGIGHGFAEANYATILDPEKTLMNSLQQCEEKMISPLERRSCALGVWGWLFNQQQYFKERGLDPVNFCDKQGEANKDICFMSAMRHFSNFFSNYFLQSINFMLDLHNDDQANELALIFAKNFGSYDRTRNENLLESLRECKLLKDNLYADCLNVIFRP